MSCVRCLAFLLLLSASAVAAPHSIWHISIWDSPAPSPDEGPPLSAGAVRDPSQLKYEVVAIVGAYLACVFVALFAVLVVGRRLRRNVRTSNRSLKMEILKTARDDQVPPSPGPKSPGKMASLKSWATGGRHSHKKSDATASTFDDRVVDLDRQRNMEEMTNLYAVVMAHDEAKTQHARTCSQGSSLTSKSPVPPPVNMIQPTQYHMPSPPLSPQAPPEFQHLRSAVAQAQMAAQPAAQQNAPTFADDRSATTSRASTKIGTPSSTKNSRSGSSQSSRPRPGHISIRGLPISQPMQSADLTRPSSHYSGGLPMSPRLYNPGPPPPAPGQQRPTSSQQGGGGPEANKRRVPAELPLSGARAATNASAKSLPFRDLYGTQDGLRTAPPTKTTFVSARESVLLHPKTGHPALPHSPYTPFTPMTPITPRLVTKKEMRKMRKEDGLAVLSEDDIVKNDDEMWGT